MNTTDKIAKIKEKLKVYQKTDEYKRKLQFDLDFKRKEDPDGIYLFEGELYVLTKDYIDVPFEQYTEDMIDKIYKQVCK